MNLPSPASPFSGSSFFHRNRLWLWPFLIAVCTVLVLTLAEGMISGPPEPPAVMQVVTRIVLLRCKFGGLYMLASSVIGAMKTPTPSAKLFRFAVSAGALAILVIAAAHHFHWS